MFFLLLALSRSLLRFHEVNKRISSAQIKPLDNLIVSDSLFVDFNVTSSGGAIYYHYANGESVITHCVFSSIYASVDKIFGGAVNVNTRLSSIESSCFFDCSCYDGQAIHVAAVEQIQISYLSVVKCPDVSRSAWASGIRISGGDQIMSSVNFSKSHILHHAAAYQTYNSLTFLGRFIEIHNCNAPKGSIIWVYGGPIMHLEHHIVHDCKALSIHSQQIPGNVFIRDCTYYNIEAQAFLQANDAVGYRTQVDNIWVDASIPLLCVRCQKGQVNAGFSPQFSEKVFSFAALGEPCIVPLFTQTPSSAFTESVPREPVLITLLFSTALTFCE